jgi:hypothetical protein
LTVSSDRQYRRLPKSADFVHQLGHLFIIAYRLTVDVGDQITNLHSSVTSRVVCSPIGTVNG